MDKTIVHLPRGSDDGSDVLAFISSSLRASRVLRFLSAFRGAHYHTRSNRPRYFFHWEKSPGRNSQLIAESRTAATATYVHRFDRRSWRPGRTRDKTSCDTASDRCAASRRENPNWRQHRHQWLLPHRHSARGRSACLRTSGRNDRAHESKNLPER